MRYRQDPISEGKQARVLKRIAGIGQMVPDGAERQPRHHMPVRLGLTAVAVLQQGEAWKIGSAWIPTGATTAILTERGEWLLCHGSGDAMARLRELVLGPEVGAALRRRRNTASCGPKDHLHAVFELQPL